MKIHRCLLLSVLLPGGLALAQWRTAGPATASGSDGLIESIRTAPNPSSTIEAYSRGLAAGRVDAVALQRAYVVRMVDLGAPELADAQAHDLLKRGAADALIAGVAAYNDAARGNAHGAVENLKLALTYSPRDSFLLRTAGQVVAWSDSQVSTPNEDAAGIEWLRAAGNGSREFTETYNLAMQARQTSGAQPLDHQTRSHPTTSSQSVGADTGSSAERPQTDFSDGSGGTSTSYSYYYYPYSSGYSNSGSYYPYTGYGYYGSASIIALRDAGGDLRYIQGFAGNPMNQPGRFSRAPLSPGNRAGAGPGSLAGRPPQAMGGATRGSPRPGVAAPSAATTPAKATRTAARATASVILFPHPVPSFSQHHATENAT